jgi:amino acid adenylation domain-containing protein
VVAVLGTLYARGAYVPIDPAYPVERQRHIANDAGVRALVVDTALSPVPAWAAADLVVDLAETAPGDSPEDLVDAPPDALLNLLYTSGSTGGPKGVQGTHGALRNRLRWPSMALPFGATDVVGHRSSLNFVDAGPEVFSGLLEGVPTAVLLPEELADLSAFVAALQRHRVTRLTVVPSLLAALLRAAPRLGDTLGALRTWITSGEALTPALLGAFREALPEATLVNLYGTTEVTGDVTAAVFRPGDIVPHDAVALGTAIADAELLVRDEHGAPAEEGELLVGGPVLGRGYHRRPSEEATRFPRHPSRANDRVFRTGDRVRRDAQGTLFFLGRTDDLVKVRGVRIETGEVERCLLSATPCPNEAAVVLADDGQLAAAVTPVDADLDALRAAAEHLPAMMRPARYVALASLPLSPNGKRDRRALRALLGPARHEITLAQSPQTDAERSLAALWRTLLRRDDIALDDTFAGLGGDSLSTAEMLLALEQRAPRVAVTLGDARDRPLADLARMLDGEAPPPPRAVARTIGLTDFGELGARDPAVVAMLVEASRDDEIRANTELPQAMGEAEAREYLRTHEGVVIRIDGEPAGAGVVHRPPHVGVGVEAPPGSVQLDEWVLARWRGAGLLDEGAAWPLLRAWLAERYDDEVSVVWEDHRAMLAILRSRGYARLGRSYWTARDLEDRAVGYCEVWRFDLRAWRSAASEGRRDSPSGAAGSAQRPGGERDGAALGDGLHDPGAGVVRSHGREQGLLDGHRQGEGLGALSVPSVPEGGQVVDDDAPAATR